MQERLINIELYKEVYAEELKTKNNIESYATLPTNLIIILAGVGLFLFQKYIEKCHQYNNSCLKAVLIILFPVFAGILARSIISLMQMYLNGFYKYQYIPSSSHLKQKEVELIAKRKNLLNKDKAKKLKKKALQDVKVEFDNYLLTNYIESSSNNRKVNDERMKAYYSSKLYLIISIFLIAFIGFLIIQK